MHKAVEQAPGYKWPVVRKVEDHAVVGYPRNLHVNHKQEELRPRRRLHDPPLSSRNVVDALVGLVPVGSNEAALGVARSDLQG
jgi:hypothetical protein